MNIAETGIIGKNSDIYINSRGFRFSVTLEVQNFFTAISWKYHSWWPKTGISTETWSYRNDRAESCVLVVGMACFAVLFPPCSEQKAVGLQVQGTFCMSHANKWLINLKNNWTSIERGLSCTAAVMHSIRALVMGHFELGWDGIVRSFEDCHLAQMELFCNR
jgi:hypothetical protein